MGVVKCSAYGGMVSEMASACPQCRYDSWIREVKEDFFKLTDTDPAPVERIRWAEAILDLAGWVTDMALFLEKEEGTAPGETWMIKHAIKRYRKSLDTLRIAVI